MNPPADSIAPSLIVWLVEDNEAYRAAAMRMIKGMRDVRVVRGFGSCEAALRELDRVEEERPGVVLLDVGLPGMSGIEGIPLLRARAPQAQVIVLTVFEDSEKVFRAICAGADGYLLKGSSFDAVRDAFDELRRGGAPMNGRIAKLVLQAFAKTASAQPDYGLTVREREVLERMVKGLTKKVIAAEIGLSIHTVDFHLRSIYQKLHVHTRTGAVSKAVREGLF
jgi:DNA-binding NarL/FixJ family response regulator